MDKGRIIGAGKQMASSVKQGVGKLVGDAKLQAGGLPSTIRQGKQYRAG